MDEVLHRLTECAESLQMLILEIMERAVLLAERTISEVDWGRLVEATKVLQGKLLEFYYNATGSTAGWLLGAQNLAVRMSAFVPNDLNKTTLYAGCVGFTLGSGVGIALSSCLHSPTRPSASMRGVVLFRDSVNLWENLPTPSIRSSHDVLIQVHLAALDAEDIRLRSRKKSEPVILGREGAGVVIEVGRDVNPDDVEVGDSVWFLLPPNLNSGALAETVVVGDRWVSRKPARLGFEGAASLPLWGVQALSAIRAAKLKGGHKVLVHCGSAGPGAIVTRLAATLGADVTATALRRASNLLSAFGAIRVIPLEDGNPAHVLLRSERFDVVFNTSGAVAEEFCQTVCKRGGSVVSTVATLTPKEAYGSFFGLFYGGWLRIYHAMFGKDWWSSINYDSKELKELSKLVDTNRLQPLVDRIFTDDELEAALSHVDSTKSVGKTLIRFSSNRAPVRPPVNRPDLLNS